MTKDEAVKYHREMWNWIADYIEATKRRCLITELKYKWCKVHSLSPEVECFACEYRSYKKPFDCITADEHRKYHAKNIPEERRKMMAQLVVERAVPAARAWHGSPEGLAWHSKNAKKMMENREFRKYVCSYCGKEFETKHIYSKKENHFCSNNCKSAFRRKLGVDDVEFVCQKCGNKFMANKYTKRKFCSQCPQAKRS